MPPDDIYLALAGPSKANRLAALDKFDNHIDPDVLALLKDIENVKLDLVDYRNKELYLSRLSTLLSSNKSEETQTAAFYHLLGTLYINFQKFWEPTIRTLTDFLKVTRIKNRFLGYLIDNLVRTSNYIYSHDEQTSEDLAKDRPDHVLHRIFILQLLAKFPEYVEKNSEIFMDQLFLFASAELSRPPFTEKNSRDDLTKGFGPKQDCGLLVPKTRETMVTMFRIVQSFQNVSIIHRQAQFKDLIFELLVCRDSSVQKAAFNCLAIYNTEFIAPYMSQLLRLLDEKKAKSELSTFALGSDSSHIQSDHREQLMPIVQRILFGRMISKVDKKTAGRDKAESRKSIIMRYISGCTVREILDFFAILFDPIYNHIDCPYGELEKALRKDLDITKYIPISKLQAMLATLGAYLESVAHQKDETLPHLLKLINVITFYVVTPLEDDQVFCKIHPSCIETLKTLRRSCLNLITEFFQTSQYYEFKEFEIDFIFKYLVWPSSRSFVDRNYAVITPILKLVNSFAQNEVYHELLLKKDPDDENVHLLQLIMILYNNAKTTRSVSIYLAQMIARLLNIIPEDEEEEEVEDDEQGVHMQFQPLLQIEATSHQDNRAEFLHESSIGLKMIMKYVPIIFDRLRDSCEKVIADKENNFRLEECELRILSTLSGYIKDSSQCMLAARLLLLTLNNQKKADVIINTLNTVQVLMEQVEGSIDSRIIDYIANVLSYQRNIEQRKELCKLTEILAKKDSYLSTASLAIGLLNSINEALVDQPDLEKWGEGFRVAFKYLDDLDVSTINNPDVVRNSLVLLLHQIGYIINTIDKYEFSVRENCGIFYEKLASKITLMDAEANEKLLQALVHDIVLNKFVKKGFRETNETIKHTYIGIARTLAVICHEKDSILSELYLLCDKNQDLDFWLNVRHIQLHNRSKALARLVASENIEKISPKTLSSYIMPLASGFLFNRAYKSVASLSDNSIKLIGMICRHLNWMTYESTLSYYLGLLTKANMTYQKTNIKLITEIVKNFSFDISACEEAMQQEDENRKLEKRMRRRCGEHRVEDLDQAQQPLKPKRLNPSTARLVYHAVTKKLIPRLNSCLHEMTRVDFESSKNMTDYLPEKDEIKRIPMAYAIVQLLNLLPCKYVLLRDNLPPLLLKLITFLKSKNEQTRKTARATLTRIMLFVGPTYVPDMLRILRQNLDKGFYVHVLNYTVHSVLSKLDLSYGDLDGSSHDIVDLCKQEIFGQASEDKEIAKVVAKTAEARKTTGYETLEILATYISPEKLDNLITPFKELLKTTSDSKTVNKLAVCIQKIWSGLAQNEHFPFVDLLEFIRSSIEESLPNLRVRNRVEAANNCDSNGTAPLREDRFLIRKDKSRDKVQSKINEKGNLHMVVENSLRLLLSTFEKNKLKIKDDDLLQQRLDAFIALLTTCLKSSSPRCVTRSLKCLSFIAHTKIDLPSFRTKSKSIVKKIFILLSLYNGVGMVQGDNYDMIAMCFKTLTFLLLKCEHVHLEPKQLGALVSYIEQDLNDVSRQATAFNALNSVLHKRCECPELATVMDKVADLLVTSSDDSVRFLSVKIWQTYLLEYKLEEPKLQNHMAKFLRQIDYEYIDGRKSVLKMLQVIVEKFPERLLRVQFELFFHLLAQRVVNDDSKEIRAIVGRLIAQLLQRLPETQDIVLVKFVLPWSSSDNLELKILGVKLLSILVETNRAIFEKNVERTNNILAILIEALNCTRDKVVTQAKTNDHRDTDAEVMEIDENSRPQADASKQVRRVTVAEKLVYHALRLFKRLLAKELIGFSEIRYLDKLKKIWQDIATDKLAHWYEPVILTACELYLLFITKTPLGQALTERDSTHDEYINRNAIRIVRLLCDRFVDLMDKFDPKTSICKGAMQALMVLGQMVANSEAAHDFERRYSEAFGGSQANLLEYMLNLDSLPNDGFVHERLPYEMSEAKKRVDLMWLSVKVVMQARKEAALHRLSATYRREFVLQWLAAIAQELSSRRIITYVFLFLMTPVRELTDKVKLKSAANAEQSVIPLAQDLLKFIKGLVGVDSFNKVYPKVQLYYTKKRIDRKKKEAISRVKDQARGVRRKLEAGRKKRAAAVVSNKRKRLA